jgi:hypothetical protein
VSEVAVVVGVTQRTRLSIALLAEARLVRTGQLGALWIYTTVYARLRAL